jgi:hypothetical protein
MRIFEDSMLNIIYRGMRDEVREEWIKLSKEKLNYLNSPPNFVGVIEWRRK